ncbi:MAG: hypothetical protein KDI36_18830 [Pseudomonadales bacterium]|nr:hypothetical protein [Pseudomonadales bacterium]
MNEEIVFEPDHRRGNTKHILLIFGGFFLFIQLTFLRSEPMEIRLAVSLALLIFLLAGLWFSASGSRNWAEKIIINHSGISSDKMKLRHGIDLVPWVEINQMDIFYTDPRLPPHLRIGLRHGDFRNKVKKNVIQRISMGLDVNIPLAVSTAPEVVLQTAERYWQSS